MPRIPRPGARVARRAVALLAVASGAVAAVSGCAGPGADLSPLEEAAIKAQDAGVDADQLEVLQSGEIGFEEYEAAMNRAYDCMREAGITVDLRGTKQYHGVTILDATTSTKAVGSGREADCYERHARYVDAYWQVESPDAVAYAARREVALRPALQQCLTDRGIDWPQDASFTELSDLAFGPGTDPAANCLDEIGYSEWVG
jgi:hypothetical protein